MASSPSTPAAGNRAVLMVFGSIALVTLLFGVFAMFRDPTKRKSSPSLLVYCAASLKTAVEQAAAELPEGNGVRVELSFGGSQTLLANIEVTKRGDLYLSADDSYFAFARERNLVGDVILLAEQTAVIAVAQGNPKEHPEPFRSDKHSHYDLTSQPDADAISKLLRGATAPSGLWMALSNRTVSFQTDGRRCRERCEVARCRCRDCLGFEAVLRFDTDFLAGVGEGQSESRRRRPAMLGTTGRGAEVRKYLADPGKGLKDFEQQGFKTLNH
jgi:hypothetical protein